MLPDSFGQFVLAFENCFTAPSFQRFITMMAGWVLCTGKRTVTGVMRAAGVVGEHEHSGYHCFFSRATWEPDAIGLVLMRLALKAIPNGVRVNLTIDDTLGRHTGKHIASAGMHRDPLLSCPGSRHAHRRRNPERTEAQGLVTRAEGGTRSEAKGASERPLRRRSRRSWMRAAQPRTAPRENPPKSVGFLSGAEGSRTPPGRTSRKRSTSRPCTISFVLSRGFPRSTQTVWRR